jgi:MoxR-like ATPase
VEMEIYRNYVSINKVNENVTQVLSYSDILELQNQVEQVFVHDEIIKSVKNIVFGTRTHANIQIGASTRSGIIFIKCLKAHALVNGRSFVTEDDIKALALPVLHHRLIFKTREAKESALQTLVNSEVDKLIKMDLFKEV